MSVQHDSSMRTGNDDEEDGLAGQRWSPEQSASLLSRLFFSWVTPLMKLGAQRALQVSDLYWLAPRDDPQAFFDRFQHEWTLQMDRYKDWRDLAIAVWKVMWREWSMVVLVNLISTLCLLALPVMFSWLIDFIGDANAPWYDGFIYLTIILIFSIVQLMAAELSYFMAKRAEMHVGSMLSLMVYRKTLRLQNVSKGNATNVMNTDPTQVADLAWFGRIVLTAPLQLLIALYMLYSWLGVAGFTPIVLILAVMPAKYWIYQVFSSTIEKVTDLRDERVKQLTEVLQGILVVKLFCWEYPVLKQINELRAKEVYQLKKFSYLQAVIVFLMISLSTIISVGTFSVYVLLGNTLDAAKVFPSLSLFGALSDTIVQIPGLLTQWSETKVSLVRLDKFLRLPQLKEKEIMEATPAEGDPNLVTIVDAAFEWQERAVVDEEDREVEDNDPQEDKSDTTSSGRDETEDESASLLSMDDRPPIESEISGGRRFKLQNISFEVKQSELVAVIGRVGSGKTSLLNSMLGEMKLLSGRCHIDASSISYVPQRPWIRNATLRENILFGQPYDPELYQTVLRACALVDDLRMLPAHDQTEIGEKGVNLSGGQKQRVSLARAVYFILLQARRDPNCLVILDDVLSAVDAHVGRHIFHECLVGQLGGISRVLATHQVQFLPYVDRIFVIQDGTISASGTYDELLRQGVNIEGIISEHSATSESSKQIGIGEASSDSQQDSQPDEMLSDEEAKERGKLIEEEERYTGEVETSVYMNYLRNTGGWVFLSLIAITSVLLEVSALFNQAWLSKWSDSGGQQTVFYLSIYLGSAVVAGLMSLSRQILWAKGTLDCARRLHDRLLEAILRAPMTFFFTTPTGRIVTRFSKDQAKVDEEVPDLMSDFFMCLFAILGMVTVIVGVLPWLLLPAALLLFLYWRLQKFFRKTSTELGRLGSLTSSPIYVQYGETLDGLDTIRAFKCESGLREENRNLVVRHLQTEYCVVSTDCWLGIRIKALGMLILIGSALTSILTKGSISEGLVGLVLALSSGVVGDLEWFVQTGAMLEAHMNSVERIIHYTATPPEAALTSLASESGAAGISSCWPTEGRIEFRDVWMKYRDELDPVLKGVDLLIEPKHTVGIVGRTGAGKSSLINALFRIVELERGAILIDGQDISTLGLHDVRSSLAIIPQDPVLFSGTIRSNLDPFAKKRPAEGEEEQEERRRDDELLWNVLTKVHLRDFVESLPQGLDTKVEVNGQNLSVGQRQLLCMGRALLREARILILDEATASVDNETDQAIQQTLRREFSGRTVVVIAHRLNTVIDMDRIAVMEEGRVVEYGDPCELMEKEDGAFAQMVLKTGHESARYLHMAAKRRERPH